MDIAIEIIMLVIVAPLTEILITALGFFITDRIKWQPFKEKYDRQVEQATDTVFTMTADPGTKLALTFALICAIFVFILNLVLYTVIYVSKGMQLNDYIIIEVVSQASVLPMLLCVLHFATKKICFIDSEIIVKSAIYVKHVNFEQITSASEIKYTKLYLALKITYNKVRKGKNKVKTIKLVQTWVNYERAKKRFSDMNLFI